MRLFVAAAVCALGGGVSLTVGDGLSTAAIGLLLLALAGVLAISGAFYLVGRSEDRARRR